MTNENDPLDLPDTDLKTLFAGIHPAAGFEDRLITAVRRQRRLRMIIPTAVQRAAIAAAAVLAVGSVGYFGSQAMNGKTHDRHGSVQNSVNTEEDSLTQGMVEALASSDFGIQQNVQGQRGQSHADSTGKQNLALGFTGGLDVDKQTDTTRSKSQIVPRWDTALESSTEWRLKNPDPNFAVTSDLKPGIDMVGGTSLKYHIPNSNDSTLADKVTKGLKTRIDPDGVRDHIWKPTDGRSASGDGVVDLAMKKPGEQPFAPLTDGEGYALKTANTSALPPTSTLIGTIVSDINNGTGSGTAATSTGTSPYNNLDSILLPSANHASSDDTLTFVTGPQSGGIQALNSGTSKIYGSQIGTAINPQGQQPSAPQTSTAPPVKPNYFATNTGLRENLVGSNANSNSSRGGDDRDNSGNTLAKTWGPSNTTFVDANGNTMPRSIAANPADYNGEKGGQSPVSAPNIDQGLGQTEWVGHLSADQEKTLVALVTGAREKIDAGKKTEALAVNDEILRIDPSNAFAGGVKPYLEGKADNENFTHNLNDAKRTLLRYEDIVPYALGRPASSGANGANAAPSIPLIATTLPVIDDRKIIRTGTMEFDVDRFDTAQMQITKIVLELGGFVGATDSQKLPNGKVRGSIAVRVPPERLDLLVLSLRALGDLKAQQITAADITKEYTDLQSELTADRAMQDRLLALIHDGKGTVKDLLAAEEELGQWRTKIEKAEGMIRYYNGQVALSTLTITLTERDIQTPATAVETETADVGIEAEDVEKARNSAIKAIDDVKGRIVEAELKRFDAGQLAARLVADVPPESAGSVIDQLKQLGKVARLEIHRQETNSNSGSNGEAAANNAASGAAPLHTERKPTRLLISIYNLANVAPRRTTNVNLAAADVEAAYAALVAATKSSGGRVVTSNLDRGDPNKATGALVLEFPPDKFDAAMATLHAQGEVLNLSSTENPDTQNSTEAKAGLTVKLISLANVAPRHTTNVALAAGDVSTAYAALIAVTKSNGGRVVTSTLEQGDPLKASGALVLELPPEKFDAAMTTLHAQGDVLKFNLMENADTQNSTEAKQGLTVRLISLAAVPPREVVQQTLAAPDVPMAYQAILSAASSTKSRVQSASLNEQDRQNISADVQVEVPRGQLVEFDKALSSAGGTIARTSGRSADAENPVDSKVQLKLSVISADHLAPRETTKLQVEVSDVDKCANDAQAAAITAGGRVLESNITKDHGKGIARIILDFPLDKSAELLNQIRSQGTVRGIDASRDPQAPTGPLAHGQIYVEFRTTEAIVADQTGPWSSIRQGLSTSVNGLLLSLEWVVVGLCLIGPWAGIAWIGWKLRNRFRSRKAEIRPSAE